MLKTCENLETNCLYPKFTGSLKKKCVILPHAYFDGIVVGPFLEKKSNQNQHPDQKIVIKITFY